MKREIKTQEYSSFDKTSKYVTKIYELEKYQLVHISETSIFKDEKYVSSSRKIQPAVNCLKHEYLKQLVLARARYEKICDLPYTIDTASSNFWATDDAEDWYSSLISSHVKQSGFLKKISKEKINDFETDVLSLDFRVYDNEKSEELRAKYGLWEIQPSSSVKDVDSVAIEEDRS